MKKNYTKKALWLNLLSFSIFIIFVILAVGSLSLSGGAHRRSPTIYHTDGSVEITYHYHDGDQTWIYRRDDEGRAHGPAVITTDRVYDDYVTEETVNFVHGRRHGRATVTRDGALYKYVCYNMGKKVDCSEMSLKNTQDNATESPSYTLLEEKYPWYLLNFDTTIFNKEYIMNFMDEIQSGLNAVTFDLEDFDDVFDDVMSDLTETPYDSIIVRIDAFLEFYGIEEAKNSDFRLAVIENYRSSQGSTFTIVEDQFPNYLKHVNEAEISTQDFETFCNDFDARMKAKPSLDVNDPAYLDSLDSRMFSVMIDIYDDAQATQLVLKSAFLNRSVGSTKERIQAYRKLLPQSVNSPEDVTLLVMWDVITLYYQAHITRHVAKETYLTSKGISELPVVTTNLEGTSSASSIIIKGNVLEDGRSTVTEKGIVWASYYNPDTDDNVETAGSGIGEYSVPINGLTEGVTYYARAYAINSNGTAYGNCIPFTSTSTALPVNQLRTPASKITIYPNPAASISNLSFTLPSTTTVMLHINDVRGRKVYTMDLGSREEGAHEVSLDLSALKDGIYFCRLQVDGQLQAANKLIIQR